MSEKKFIVRMVQYWEYEVTAEDADDAAQMISEGEGVREGTCHGYGIDGVVSAEKAGQVWEDEDDERAKCVCGHLFVDQHNGLWSGELGKHPKPHPRACDKYDCDCLAPVEAVAG